MLPAGVDAEWGMKAFTSYIVSGKASSPEAAKPHRAGGDEVPLQHGGDLFWAPMAWLHCCPKVGMSPKGWPWEKGSSRHPWEAL